MPSTPPPASAAFVQQPLSGTDMAALALGVIALLQCWLWWRDRESGMGWLAAAFALNTVLAANNDRWLPNGLAPNLTYLGINLGVHLLYAFGLVAFVGFGPRHRRWILTGLMVPLAVGVLLVALQLGRPWVLLPLLVVSMGYGALSVVGARREPGAGFELLVLGAFVGPIGLGIAWWQGRDPVDARYYAWPGVINLGLGLLVISLTRRSRASQRAEQLARRLSNFYEALSQTGRRVAGAQEPLDLYRAVCGTCVEFGQASMAWVAQPLQGHAMPVAWAGPGDDYLPGLRISIDPGSPDAGLPVAGVLRTGQAEVVDDLVQRLAPFGQQARAERFGVRSAAFLPLHRHQQVVAVLAVYAKQPGFFDADVLRLLRAMCSDVSQGLDQRDLAQEHARAVQAARAGEQRFQRAFNASPVPAEILHLADGSLLAVNDASCRRYGLAREAMVGRRLADLGLGPASADVCRCLASVRTDGAVRDLELPMHTGGGVWRDMLLSMEPLEFDQQPCLLAISVDVTDRNRAQAARQAQLAAETANQAKTDFLSRMSHELRTPLNCIIGFSQLLHQSAGHRLSDSGRHQLDLIRQAAAQLEALTDDVLDLSLLEAGRLPLSVQSVAPQALVDGVLRLCQLQAASKRVGLRCELPDGAPPPLQVDPTRLRQILFNLVVNGIKYNRPGGAVNVVLSSVQGGLQIDVVDDGVGMTPEQVDALFQPFNRLGREHAGIEGTGLGLALTHQLVQLLGGSIIIRSTVGHGTRARVMLPATPQTTPLTPPQPTPGGAGRADAVADMAAALSDLGTAADGLPDPALRGRLLYIEDDPVNALLVEQVLLPWTGLQLVVASTAQEGLAQARRLRPDLVLLDMNLPDASGLDVLRELRQGALADAVPVIVLSASAMPDDVAAAKAAGAAAYWTKPIHLGRFTNQIRHHLQATVHSLPTV